MTIISSCFFPKNSYYSYLFPFLLHSLIFTTLCPRTLTSFDKSHFGPESLQKLFQCITCRQKLRGGGGNWCHNEFNISLSKTGSQTLSFASAFHLNTVPFSRQSGCRKHTSTPQARAPSPPPSPPHHISVAGDSPPAGSHARTQEPDRAAPSGETVTPGNRTQSAPR